MKEFLILSLVAALALVASCQKPTAAPATPASRVEPSPRPKDQKARSKGVTGIGQMEDTQPMPIPTNSVAPR